MTGGSQVVRQMCASWPVKKNLHPGYTMHKETQMSGGCTVVCASWAVTNKCIQDTPVWRESSPHAAMHPGCIIVPLHPLLVVSIVHSPYLSIQDAPGVSSLARATHTMCSGCTNPGLCPQLSLHIVQVLPLLRAGSPTPGNQSGLAHVLKIKGRGHVPHLTPMCW